MRIRSIIFKATLAVSLMGLPVVAIAQGVSINTFSPYSFYGIGDLAAHGAASQRSMGGVGIGLRTPTAINTLNPASYSAIARQTALFYVGMEGQNRYLSSATTRSSYNSFNISEIALQIPLTKGLGLTVSIAPYSNIGYRISSEDNSNETWEDIGYVRYMYSGAGGVNTYKLGAGYAITDWLSIGAQMIYYQGNITRNYTQSITQVTGSGSYIGLSSDNHEQVNRILGDFGLQARLFSKKNRNLTLGLFYSMGGNLNSRISETVMHSPSYTEIGLDEVVNKSYRSSFRLPHSYGGGLYYSSAKLSAGVDYRYNGWGVNGTDENFDVTYCNTHSVAAGVQFIPNAGDVRRYLNRWAYRFGIRYDQGYMMMNGHVIDEIAVSLGFGIPLDSTGKSNVDVGIEFGTRGTTVAGLVKENFVSVSVGLSLFGSDFWFMKYKYD